MDRPKMPLTDGHRNGNFGSLLPAFGFLAPLQVNVNMGWELRAFRRMIDEGAWHAAPSGTR